MGEMPPKTGDCEDREQKSGQTILAQRAATFRGGRTIPVMAELFSGNDSNQNQHIKSYTYRLVSQLGKEDIVPVTE